ncbi:MAG: hypothetical protein ACREMF_04350, partial [Gemmatimonadales bacterium]
MKHGGQSWSLATLGWTDALADAFAPHVAPGSVPGRLAAQHKSQYVLYTPRGEVRASLAGRLRHVAARPS